MYKIILFSPSIYSNYTLCVAEMLRQKDLEIAGIFAVKLFNRQRIKNEIRHNGTNLINKCFNKIIFRNQVKDYYCLASLKRDLHITSKHLKIYARQHQIPIWMVENLNTPFVANKLQEIQPDLAVFTGGGIIRESILTKCGHGVINCHEGILPYYRGRSTIEWPILLNDFNNIGISTHLMTKNIDEGPILTTQRIPFIPNEKFSDYHHRLAPLMCEELVNSSVQLLNHKIIPQFQAKQEGKLFFKMGRYALELAQEKMCC